MGSQEPEGPHCGHRQGALTWYQQHGLVVTRPRSDPHSRPGPEDSVLELQAGLGAPIYQTDRLLDRQGMLVQSPAVHLLGSDCRRTVRLLAG